MSSWTVSDFQEKILKGQSVLKDFGKITLSILFCILFITGCVEEEADINNLSLYEKQNLTFNYPSNWKVTEDITNEEVRFIFIETSGEAITKIEIYNKDRSYELKEFVELDIKAIKQEMPKLLKMSKNKIEKINTSINGLNHSGYKYDFNLNLIGIEVPHTSEFYMYLSTEKIAYLVNQVAKEDLKKVKKGFNIILTSIKFSSKLNK